jgi:hypothetical protein
MQFDPKGKHPKSSKTCNDRKKKIHLYDNLNPSQNLASSSLKTNEINSMHEINMWMNHEKKTNLMTRMELNHENETNHFDATIPCG